jgi:hypothetical protein
MLLMTLLEAPQFNGENSSCAVLLLVTNNPIARDPAQINIALIIAWYNEIVLPKLNVFRTLFNGFQFIN